MELKVSSEKSWFERILGFLQHFLSARLLVVAALAFKNFEFGHGSIDLEHNLFAVFQVVELSVNSQNDLLAFLLEILLDDYVKWTTNLTVTRHIEINPVRNALVAHQLHFVIVINLLESRVTFVTAGLHDS